jgi:iron complex outermembrane receptor protein
MNGSLRRLMGVCAIAAGIGSMHVSGALAQDGGASGSAPVAGETPRSGLETVTVSGTKREESSQEVPIAITAISEAALAQTFRNDILAVSDMSAGVALGQMAGFRAVSGGIRGTGQNSILVTQDSSVAILVDEIGLNHVQSQFVELFDVERVEVYRGPQGTLFGKNATGGAISIITKRPVLNEFTGDVEFQLGMFDSNNGKIAKGKVAINVPVVEDKLAVRLTAIYDYDDGYYSNTKDASSFPNLIPLYGAFGLPTVNPPLPPELFLIPGTTGKAAGGRANGTDVFAGKFKVLFTPTDNYEAYFIMEVLRDHSESVVSENDSPIIGQIDPDGGPQAMLLPLLGFASRTQVDPGKWVSAIDNQCAGNNPRGLCVPSGHRVEVMGYNLQQSLNLDAVDFKLITAYRKQKEILPSTYPGEAFASLFSASRNLEREQIQLELRAATKFDGPVNFVAGGTYQEDNVSMRSFAIVGLSGLLPQTDMAMGRPANGNLFLDDRGFVNLNLDILTDPTTGGADQDRTTYAFYFDGNWDITDRLRLTAGIRWTLDKKDFFRRANNGGACNQYTKDKDKRLIDTDGNPSTPAVCFDARSNAISRGGLTAIDIDPRRFPLPDSQYSLVVRTDDKWDRITWRTVLDYKVTDEALLYASYATGFISGGFTETCSSVRTCIPFQPEKNWNAELGLKARWFDNTLQTNMAVFYTQYSDLIRSQVVPFTDFAGNTTQETINVNAGKSRNIGVELEVNWLPTEALQIDLSAAYMDHKYKEFLLDRNGDGKFTGYTLANGWFITENLEDYNVPYSPKWKIGASITYNVALGNSGTLTLNTIGNYQSEAETSVFNSLNTQMEERFLWDASATWRDVEERYRVTLFMKNILNEYKRLGANSVAGLWNMTIYGRPRTYGLEVGFHF